MVKRVLERIFGGMPRKTVFRLNSSTSTFEISFFIPSLKLDVASLTIIADTFVLILDDDKLKSLQKPLDVLRPSVCEFNDVPKVASCEACYPHSSSVAGTGSTPKSARISIKAPRRGQRLSKVTQRKEWVPFAPYVTRLVLSPLFAVSFLEPIYSNCDEALAMFGWSKKDLQDATQIQNSAPTNNPAGQLTRCSQCGKLPPDEKLMMCARYQKAAYCGREYQAAAWKQNKVSCKTV